MSFVIGGAAGTALSPLPWKLTDDSSIWSQTWPWTPVPEDGEYTYENTVCTLCPGGCGISVRKVDQRAVKIEGRAGHPINDGGICLLGLSGLQLLYGPTRVQSPMKRVGDRGQGQWKVITWNEAIDTVAAKLSELREAGTPQQAGCIVGSDRSVTAQLIDRFLQAYGSANFIKMPDMTDAYDVAFQRMHGKSAQPGFDVENADFVISFGSDVIEGWGSPVQMFRANSDWKASGATLVQVEPRLSTTAAKADTWLPVKPGTEAVLALGLAHVLIQENRYHTLFVHSYCAGFIDFKNRVLADYTPEKVAQATGLDKSTIISLARAFAGSRRPLALAGRGQGRTGTSAADVMAVHMLNALVGNINQKGGVIAIPEMTLAGWPEPEMDGIANAGNQAGRVDEAGSDRYPDVRHRAHALADRILSGAYPLSALFVHNANPLFALPDTAAVKAAIDKIPFVVSFSSFMDETAANADLILPDDHYLERYELIATPVGATRPMMELARPVVEPVCNTMSTGDVVMAVAQALGDPIASAFPWDSFEACLEETVAEWDTLTEDGLVVDDSVNPADWNTAFETDSGKFEFVALDAVTVDAQGDTGSYPLTLIPYNSMRLATGYIGSPPFMMKTVEDTILKGNEVMVEVNPETAHQLGIQSGQRASLETPKGRVRVRVFVFDGVMPGLVAMPRGLGHSAYDGYLANKGENVNALIGPVDDPASGLNAAWGIRAKLSKA